METTESYQALAISLGLGLLIGLQRQWKDSEIAGIRTFPLISLMGTLTGLFSENQFGWVSGAGLLALAILLAIANVAKIRAGEFDFGMTTEVAALLMFVVGCVLGVGLTGPAIVNVRVLVEIGVVAPALLGIALLPMSAMLVLMVIECVVLYIPQKDQTSEAPDHDNPA